MQYFNGLYIVFIKLKEDEVNKTYMSNILDDIGSIITTQVTKVTTEKQLSYGPFLHNTNNIQNILFILPFPTIQLKYIILICTILPLYLNCLSAIITFLHLYKNNITDLQTFSSSAIKTILQEISFLGKRGKIMIYDFVVFKWEEVYNQLSQFQVFDAFVSVRYLCFRSAVWAFSLAYSPSLLFLVVGGYVGVSMLVGKNISNRKKITLASYSDPTEGTIYLRQPIRVDKLLHLLSEHSKHSSTRLTITHFVIKACGEVLKHSDDINRCYSFGKFLPHEGCNISCPVDIGDGKDVAFMLVRDVDRKSVEEIARFVEEKAMSMKSGKGGEEHRKRTASVSMLPSFVVSVSITLVAFITTKLGLSIPSLSFERGQFGAGCVSAVGKFGFEDSYAPMPGFMQCSFIAIINAIKRVPVIQDDDSIRIGQVMNVNFSVDHRVVDGAKGRKFLEVFKQVMQNPEQYVTSSEGNQRKEDKGKNIKEQ